MNLRILSKKTLAVVMTMAMLLSCMVWSGVSAATTYTCDFTGYAKVDPVNDVNDTDVTGGSIATLVDTGEADYGSAMKLQYQDGATGPWAGFRFFAGTNERVQYNNSETTVKYFYVEYEYKVLSVAGSVELRTGCGSLAWSNDNYNPNGYGSSEVIETLTGPTEWKTARTAVQSAPQQNSAVHIYLNADNPAAAAGTAVLVDNVTVVKDYEVPTVVFDLNHDSLTETKKGATGNAVSFPADPVRNGYDFIGWFDAAEGGNPVTALTFGESGTTRTVYAQWEAASSLSTLTFDVNGGVAIEPVTGATGAAASVADPQKNGYKFAGWYSDVDLQNKVTTLTFPAENGATATVHAKWDAVDYLVVKTDFNTWPTKIDGTDKAGYSTTGDSTGDNTAKVWYDEANGYMKLTPVGTLQRSMGFRLFGNQWQQTIWNGTADQQVVGGSDNSRAVGGLTYRITFKYKVVALSVPTDLTVYNKDGSLNTRSDYETDITPDSKYCMATKTLTAADVSDEWATFEWTEFTAAVTEAWRIGVHPSGNVATEGDVEILIDDIVIEWIPNSRRAAIELNYNDGITPNGFILTESGKDPVVGTTVTLPTPAATRPGYKFVGWVDAEGNPAPETLTVGSLPVAYTATWEEDASTTGIAFEENGGAEIADIYGTAGTVADLPTTTRGLYTFVGWYLDEALEIPAEGVTFPEEGTLTLYAKWNDPVPADNDARPSGVIGTMDFETGTAADYFCQTGWAGVMEVSDVQAHSGEKSFLHLFKSGHNGQRGRPRIALQLGDATKATPLTVKAGESYTISFWIRADRQLTQFTFYAATMGASDFDTMINKDNNVGGEVHTLQTLSYFAVGTNTNGAFNDKEPKELTLQAEQWTRVIMTVPSIVLDDANDVNYLTIGYSASDFTPGKEAPDCNVYIDDVTVCTDMELNGTLLGTQTFESGTAANFTRFTSKYNMAVSTDFGHAGSASSLKAEIRGTSNSQRGRPRLVLKLGDATTAGNFVVEEGKSYTVSFWARVAGANHGTFAFYLATMGASDVDTMINKDNNTGGDVHTLQTLSYCSNGIPMAGGSETSWGAAKEVANAWLSADMWQQIVMTIPAATLDAAGEDNYLALGYTFNKATTNDFSADLYIDDIAIYDTTFVDGAELLDDVNSAYQYVGGTEQDNNKLGAAEGSAVYDRGDGQIRTAFRVGGTFTPGAELTKVKINGKTYDVVERGVLLGYGDVTVPTLENNKGKATATDLNSYWTKNESTGKVTFTALVKGVSAEMVNTQFVARSYMKILVGGEEVLIYSKVSAAFTPQSIYDKACAQSGTAYTWFE